MSSTTERPDLGEACRSYVEALERSSMRDAVKLVAGLVRGGVPLADVVGGVLGPAQVEVGVRWETGRWSVAQEHTATGITEVALQTAVLTAGIPLPHEGQPSLVLACADGEWHALGARMAADVLRVAGVDVTYVGASLPSEALGEFLAMHDPTALGLSCSTAMTLVGARETIVAAHEAGMPVLVSGSAFGPDARRAEAIGADAWVGGADAAVEVLAAWAARRPTELRRGREPATEEWRELATAPVHLVEAVMDELARTRPRLSSVSKGLVARLRKEASYLLRCLAASELTDDPSMLEDYTRWLRVVMTSRKVPVDVLDDLYACAARALEEPAPGAADLLTQARRLLRPSGVRLGAPAADVANA